MNYYISDTHFGHKNIIRYDNRPFDSVEEMDEAMIQLWNETVNDTDAVYILGDFSWYKEDKTASILEKLKGHKILIKGNHDRVSSKVARYFDRVCDYAEVKDNGRKVIMSHYPMPFWNGQHRDTVHLYGHVHNSSQYNYCLSIEKELRQLQDIPMRMFNVGCMMKYMNYMPRTLDEILSNGGDIDGQK